MSNPNEPQVRINLADLTDIICDKCGDTRFEPIYLMKRLSALLSPTGKEEIVPLGPPVAPPIFACYNCGHINEEFIPAPLRTKKVSGIVQSTLETPPVTGPTLVKE
jgi:hypothetical protein